MTTSIKKSTESINTEPSARIYANAASIITANTFEIVLNKKLAVIPNIVQWIKQLQHMEKIAELANYNPVKAAFKILNNLFYIFFNSHKTIDLFIGKFTVIEIDNCKKYSSIN